MIQSAIRYKRSFNLIHMPSTQKVDIFPATSEFHAKQLDRAARTPVFGSDPTTRFPLASPEDVLISKLHWYRLGGEASETQWSDIRGLLEHNPLLDLPYMREWARRVGVDDLLSSALSESHGDQTP